MKKSFILIVALLFVAVVIYRFISKGKHNDFGSGTEWVEYLGGPDRNHYSHLDQINVNNVGKLVKAWEYRTGDVGEMQCNPLVINNVLYGTTATCDVFALNAATGEEIWRFVPDQNKSNLKSRGLTYWKEGNEERLFSTHREWLYCLDPKTGKPIPDFGENGRTSLKAGLEKDAVNKYVMSRTPGTIFEDLIVMPLVVMEEAESAQGYIQAFNVRTGKLEWVFHTIPRKGEFGYDTWPEDVIETGLAGGVNNWSGMAIDRKRGILYAPTGSPSPDFYGGSRKGQNLFASTLLALDARTGKRLWHFQMVHHDIWDRDPAPPPNLVTLKKDGKPVDVVIQMIKSSSMFIFDRVTGEPFYPIEERPVPPSRIPEESAWPTQPFPTIPKPFARQQLTENDLNTKSEDYDSLREIFGTFRKGTFLPLDEEPTLIFPGLDGGPEYGGAAIDPDGIMYVNANEMGWVLSLSRAEPIPVSVPREESIYLKYCSTCHKADRSGDPASGYPNLRALSSRMNEEQLENIIRNGRGMMPGFPQITAEELEGLKNFMLDKPIAMTPENRVREVKPPREPWKFNGYKKFLDSEGYPAISQPWGTFTAIDLNTGEFKWQVPLGNIEKFQEPGGPHTGIENYGGPVVTAGGVLFIAATKDSKMRAFNKENGELLWETDLPASAFATPTTYRVNGKQYVVIACGGAKRTPTTADSYIAFTLP